ncbi:MAG: thiosulfate oxidation carrier protein SoxY [Gammaproteobacteria bacterium]|nr:MAG: thiosulfate oxidation carrier protein SoxY [Gammaproteobacteria bacterium]UCH41576.1 MAG: thiosulfate oxidation carrier protein SoxY [Gammaproteobacteria bacterium]
MNLLRRKFLKTATFVGAAVTVGTGVLVPQRALAAYAKAAFEAKDVSGALTASMGSDQHSASDAIKLKAPDIAENGAVVPVTVSSTMGNVEAISIVATGNNQPLTSTYALTPACEPFVSTRIKMGKTSDVIAVVKADGKLYSTTKEVKVTIGGCGG